MKKWEGFLKQYGRTQLIRKHLFETAHISLGLCTQMLPRLTGYSCIAKQKGSVLCATWRADVRSHDSSLLTHSLAFRIQNYSTKPPVGWTPKRLWSGSAVVGGHKEHMDAINYTGMFLLSLSTGSPGWTPWASTGPHNLFFHLTLVISWYSGLQPPSHYFRNFKW